MSTTYVVCDVCPCYDDDGRGSRVWRWRCELCGARVGDCEVASAPPSAPPGGSVRASHERSRAHATGAVIGRRLRDGWVYLRANAIVSARARGLEIEQEGMVVASRGSLRRKQVLRLICWVRRAAAEDLATELAATRRKAAAADLLASIAQATLVAGGAPHWATG